MPLLLERKENAKGQEITGTQGTHGLKEVAATSIGRWLAAARLSLHCSHHRITKTGQFLVV